MLNSDGDSLGVGLPSCTAIKAILDGSTRSICSDGDRLAHDTAHEVAACGADGHGQGLAGSGYGNRNVGCACARQDDCRGRAGIGATIGYLDRHIACKRIGLTNGIGRERVKEREALSLVFGAQRQGNCSSQVAAMHVDCVGSRSYANRNLNRRAAVTLSYNNRRSR